MGHVRPQATPHVPSKTVGFYATYRCRLRHKGRAGLSGRWAEVAWTLRCGWGRGGEGPRPGSCSGFVGSWDGLSASPEWPFVSSHGGGDACAGLTRSCPAAIGALAGASLRCCPPARTPRGGLSTARIGAWPRAGRSGQGPAPSLILAPNALRLAGRGRMGLRSAPASEGPYERPLGEWLIHRQGWLRGAGE